MYTRSPFCQCVSPSQAVVKRNWMCVSRWNALQPHNTQRTASRSEQSHLPEIKDRTRSEVLWKMPDDKYWHKQDDRKSNRSRDSTRRRLVFVVLFCMQPAEFHQRVIIHVKWQAADVKDGGKGTSTSLALSLIVLGQGFILFFSVVIVLFLLHRD